MINGISSIWNLGMRNRRGSKRGNKNRSQPLTQDRFTARLTQGFVREYISEADREEKRRIGRQLALKLLGNDANPQAALEMDLIESDQEYRNELRELLLEERRAKIDAMRSRNRPYWQPNDGGEDDEMKEVMRQAFWERYQNGPEGGAGMSWLGPALASLVQALPAILAGAQGQAQSQGQEQNRNEGTVISGTVTQVLEPGVGAAVTPQEDSTVLPRLMDLFDPGDVEQLLSMPNKEEAGQAAVVAVKQAVANRPEPEQAKAAAMLDMLMNANFWAVCVMLEPYKRYPEWAPIVSYIEQHQEEFEDLQTGIEIAMGKEAAGEGEGAG